MTHSPIGSLYPAEELRAHDAMTPGERIYYKLMRITGLHGTLGSWGEQTQEIRDCYEQMAMEPEFDVPTMEEIRERDAEMIACRRPSMGLQS